MSKLTKLNRCGYADQYRAIRAPKCGCEFCGMKWLIKQLQTELDELKRQPGEKFVARWQLDRGLKVSTEPKNVDYTDE